MNWINALVELGKHTINAIDKGIQRRRERRRKRREERRKRKENKQ